MKITHPRIIGFFKNHPDIDAEATILKFVDIMESLHENMNKTMNNSVELVNEDFDSNYLLKLSNFEKYENL